MARGRKLRTSLYVFVRTRFLIPLKLQGLLRTVHDMPNSRNKLLWVSGGFCRSDSGISCTWRNLCSLSVIGNLSETKTPKEVHSFLRVGLRNLARAWREGGFLIVWDNIILLFVFLLFYITPVFILFIIVVFWYSILLLYYVLVFFIWNRFRIWYLVIIEWLKTGTDIGFLNICA